MDGFHFDKPTLLMHKPCQIIIIMIIKYLNSMPG